MSLDHSLADGKILSYAVHYGGGRHSTLALLAPAEPGAENPGANWRILPPRFAPKVKPEILWENEIGPKFNSFVITEGLLLAAGQLPSADQTNPFLWAFMIQNGEEVFRHALPAPVVKGGTAMDSGARIIASLQDGRVLCFEAAN